MRLAWIALGMTIAWGAWGQSQPPASGAAKPSGAEQPLTNRSTENSSPIKNPAPAPAVSLAASPAINANPTHTTERKESDNSSRGREWIEIIGSIITVLATAVIAVFTVRLSDSTKNLWEDAREAGKTARDAANAAAALVRAAQAQVELMDVQKGLMQSSLEATQKAANAAELSAKAAIGVELPKLMPVGLDFAAREVTLKEKIRLSLINVSVKNYGRTPAFITSHCVEIVWGQGLPAEPDYRQTAKVSPDTVVESGGLYELKGLFPRATVPEEAAEAVRDGTLSLWVYGFVRYRDFLGEPHESRFCKDFVRVFTPPDDREIYFFGDSANNKKYTESY